MFDAAGWGDIAYAFLFGVKFDTAAILLTNAPLFLLWMLPTRWLTRPWFQRAELGVFAIINMLCLGVSFVDAEFVKFIGKRSSYDILFIREDVERQSFSVLFTYWYFCLGLAALVALLVWWVPRFAQEQESKVRATLYRIAAVILIFLGMRGGFGFKPINPMQAYFSTHHELGLLTLNTPINLIKTRPNGAIARTRYFATSAARPRQKYQ